MFLVAQIQGRRTAARRYGKPFFLLSSSSRLDSSNTYLETQTVSTYDVSSSPRMMCLKQVVSSITTLLQIYLRTTRPMKVPTAEGQNTQNDILVLVKEYIASANLAQLPLLVLTPESRQVFRLSTDRRC